MPIIEPNAFQKEIWYQSVVWFQASLHLRGRVVEDLDRVKWVAGQLNVRLWLDPMWIHTVCCID